MTAPPTTDTTSLLTAIPTPIAGGLGFLVVLLGLISEVRGWTHGPINKRVTSAAERNNEARQEAEDGWKARDRRVEELEAAMETMRDRLDAQGLELRALHALGDAQNRLLAEHTGWDRRAQAEVNKLGGNLPPPPPLYVYEENP